MSNAIVNARPGPGDPGKWFGNNRDSVSFLDDRRRRRRYAEGGAADDTETDDLDEPDNPGYVLMPTPRIG